MRYLLAVRTVNDAAALCDYLQEHRSVDDEVLAATVHPPDPETPDSDRREALNVVDVRLLKTTVETVERRGEEFEEVVDLAAERDVDAVVVGRAPEAVDDARAELEDALDVPVRVVEV